MQICFIKEAVARKDRNYEKSDIDLLAALKIIPDNSYV